MTNTERYKKVFRDDIEHILSECSDEIKLLESKNILITGGAGFLGYYLIQSLCCWNELNPGKEIKIIVLDNFSRGYPSWLEKYETYPFLKLIKHDINKPLPETVNNFQYVIHAASIASPIYYRKHPIETMDANVNGLRYLLDYSVDRKCEIEGFLYFSTSEIYGDPSPENIPTKESYRGNVSCTGPRACYDESKRFGETLCVNFSNQYGLPIKIVRPFNNYGPGLKITDGRALPDFARSIFLNKDIILFSDGRPTRTFCYVADAVCGYLKALVIGQNGESYNIGSEKPEISIIDLAQKCVLTSKNLFNYQGKIVFNQSNDKDYLVDNPNRRCPSIDKARKHLNFDPKILIDEGLERSLIWYNENRSSSED